MANYFPMRDVERLADALFEAPLRGPRQMPMDLYRDGDHYILSADLPGIDPGSVDVDVDGQLLTIRAERTLPNAENVKWITRERTSGSFLRQLSLGQGIDTDRISANYENGVLSVMIPVSERAKPRKVAVTTGGVAEGTIEADAPQAQLENSNA
ncbi:Hsp20/alpha crystallin family protein [Leucobacter ruminantium]|uniref:Hsp20/alpha crystallin family protein n=1 Tax=Leucobacter ruminantium TaxID=1289170 RepID=A0A939RU27_9MICO|nr:Hsp20/alpha crystallin family protein [Leucobacter ruminantium]MBO1805205.1 Hsp20/alpha crystallin family protein [Leucobacter ruminantium]